jgi:hypothetical protein
MRWVGLLACIGEKRNACQVLATKHEGRRPFENLGMNSRKILKWILMECGGGIRATTGHGL